MSLGNSNLILPGHKLVLSHLIAYNPGRYVLDSWHNKAHCYYLRFAVVARRRLRIFIARHNACLTIGARSGILVLS